MLILPVSCLLQACAHRHVHTGSYIITDSDFQNQISFRTSGLITFYQWKIKVIFINSSSYKSKDVIPQQTGHSKVARPSCCELAKVQAQSGGAWSEANAQVIHGVSNRTTANPRVMVQLQFRGQNHSPEAESTR